MKTRISLLVKALLLGIALVIFQPQLAFAAISISQDTVNFTEHASDDVYLAGGKVVVTGKVDGDLFITAGEVSVEGDVGGNLFVASGKTHLSGSVDQSVFIINGASEINGTIGNSLYGLGGDISVGSDVKGNVSLAASNIDITKQSTIAKDANLAGDNVNVEGSIQGNINLDAEEYDLDEAVISGQENIVESQVEDSSNLFVTIWSFIKNYIGWMLLAACILLLFPRSASEIKDIAKAKLLPCLGIGVLALILLFPIAATLVLLSVFIGGMQLLLFLSALVFICLLGAYIIGAYALGDLLLQKIGTVQMHPVGIVACVILIVELCNFIPYIGFLPALLLAIFGFGAILIYLRNYIRNDRSGYALPQSVVE